MPHRADSFPIISFCGHCFGVVSSLSASTHCHILVSHRVLQVILLSLNAFLFYCAVVGVNRPHYEIMFLLSLCLTGSYVWYVGAVLSRGAPTLCPWAPLAACWQRSSPPRAGPAVWPIDTPPLTPCGHRSVPV